MQKCKNFCSRTGINIFLPTRLSSCCKLTGSVNTLRCHNYVQLQCQYYLTSDEGGDDEHSEVFFSPTNVSDHRQRFMLADYVPLNREESATHWETRKMPSTDAVCSIAKQSPEARLRKLGHSLRLLKTSWINLQEVLRKKKSQSTVARTEVGIQANTIGEVTLQEVMRA